MIDIFHTDADGNVDLDARLIPGLEHRRVGGAQASALPPDRGC